MLAENPEKAAQYAAGKKGLMGFFVGQVLKRSGETRGRGGGGEEAIFEN